MIHNSIYGQGKERAIALYGLFGHKSNFDPLLGALDPERWTVLVPDIRGYGECIDTAGPYDMTTIASDILELADHLQWSAFSLIAHSMGGKVALRTAILAPERVKRILGLAPIWGGALHMDQENLGLFRSSVEQVSIRGSIIRNTTGKCLSEYWSAQIATLSFASSAKEAYAAYIESFVFDDFDTAAALLKQPILLLVGAHDAVTTAMAKNQWQVKLAHAEVHVFPDCGHWPLLELPLLSAAKIEDFVARDPR